MRIGPIGDFEVHSNNLNTLLYNLTPIEDHIFYENVWKEEQFDK